jgi:signal transduction histidine kinase
MAVTTTETTEDLARLDWLVCHIRWGWLLLIAVFIVTESWLSVASSPNFILLLSLVAVGVALNGLYVGLLWAKYFPTWVAVVATILDTTLAVGLLLLLSRHAQLLLPLMLFPVIMSSVRWNTETGLLTALPIILSYATPLIPILGGDVINRTRLIDVLLTLGMTSLTLFLGGALPGIFIERRINLTKAANIDELNQLRRANDRGKLITEMALTMSATTNYHKVLRSMIDLAFSALAEADLEDETTVGMVLLFQEESSNDANKLTVVVGHNLARRDEGRKIETDSGLISRTLSTAEATITHNVQRDKILTSFASTPGCRSAICAPLRAGYNTYGVVLFCTTEPNFYNEDHKALLTTFCSQAIIALQNAQLFEDLRHEQHRILERDAEARHKLARDLHDGPTQSIAAIAMRLNFIKMVIQNRDLDKAYDEIVKVEEISQKTTQEIRTMLFAMRPVILETQGLIAALDQYAEKLNATESFDVAVRNRDYEGQLDGEAEGVVFAIVQEAIGNAKKHSQATQINVNLLAQNGSLYVEVKDNGVGFDLEATKATYDQRTSLGLINMDERAREIGGRSILESEPGKGTRLRLQVPFHRQEDY